ncbi:hypothetical protein [Granulicella tundricola]|uniref:Uncharacterized protein n=1 Tax=Granulicella tundricola (strain ATCC BAA-1859 / DSM 23138 / MP5ACTX9) TaxID=1198114 RepID=E8WWW1_GRATM|nr:hypothetical protein [Granulicella tundricola]ADW68522.1 hypothetical protein AciX9_1469 [Granulicella tundricola MP5ACTX9]
MASIDTYQLDLQADPTPEGPRSETEIAAAMAVFDSLRGICKDIYAELGGSEAVLQEIRESWEH